jgi:hypothetical protein
MAIQSSRIRTAKKFLRVWFWWQPAGVQNVESIGLEGLGIATNPYIQVDAQLRTRHRHIFSVGDVNGLDLLDSSASSADADSRRSDWRR